MLDRFNIINNLVETNTDLDNQEKERQLYFNNKRRMNKYEHNHLINYINDDGLEYIVDITTYKTLWYYAYNQSAYPFFSDSNKNNIVGLPLFNNSSLYKNMNYDKLSMLTLDEQKEIFNIVCRAIELFNKNIDLFVDFYFQNQRYYHKINSAYKSIYEEEKRLGLIRK